MAQATSNAPVGVLDAGLDWALDEVAFGVVEASAPEISTSPHDRPSKLKTDMNRSKSYFVSKSVALAQAVNDEDGWFDGNFSTTTSPEPKLSSISTTSGSTPVRAQAKPSAISRAKSESHVEDNRPLQSSSAINDAARIKAWTEVCRLCRTAPLDAAYRDSDGWTALHHATNRRPPEFPVEALVLAHPDAVFWAEKTKGMTPLHYACRFKASLEVIKLLLSAARKAKSDHAIQDMSPEEKVRWACSSTCKKGRTPLYYALRYDAPDGVMELLLKHYPLGGIRFDKSGLSPLKYVWDTGRKNLATFRVVASELCTSQSDSRSEIPVNILLERRLLGLLENKSSAVRDFAKTFLTAVKLVCAAHFELKRFLLSDEDGSISMKTFDCNALPTDEVLHALTNVGACHLHPSLWELGVMIYDYQARLFDCDGNLPLHYALMPCHACSCLHNEEVKPSTAHWAEHSTVSTTNGALYASTCTLGSLSSASSFALDQPSPTSSVNPSLTPMVVAGRGETLAIGVLSSDDIVLDLLELYSAGAEHRNSNGILPLHQALLSNNYLTLHLRLPFCRRVSFGWRRSNEAAKSIEAQDISIEWSDDWNQGNQWFHERETTDHLSSGTGVIGRLVKYNPRALEEEDKFSRLLPFMIPSTYYGKKLDSDLDRSTEELHGTSLSFDLLLECPGLVSLV